MERVIQKVIQEGPKQILKEKIQIVIPIIKKIKNKDKRFCRIIKDTPIILEGINILEGDIN